MESAFPDQVHFARFMRLITETKIVAARVFPKHSDMFPGGLVSMYNVPLDLQALSRNVKADYLESNLKFLKELDSQLPDTTLSEPTQPSSSAPIQLPAAVPAPLATESVSDPVNQVLKSNVPRMPETMTVKG
jgi:hypothetical protein